MYKMCHEIFCVWFVGSGSTPCDSQIFSLRLLSTAADVVCTSRSLSCSRTLSHRKKLNKWNFLSLNKGFPRTTTTAATAVTEQPGLEASQCSVYRKGVGGTQAPLAPHFSPCSHSRATQKQKINAVLCIYNFFVEINFDILWCWKMLFLMLIFRNIQWIHATKANKLVKL